jgi:hypothetical protein
MFGFLHPSTPRYPSVREALVASGLPAAGNPATVAVVNHHGSYVGRHVNFFRAFDPTTPTARTSRIQAYADLDGHAELVLGSGHVEREGQVVVYGRQAAEGPTPARWKADRAVHADDERFVNRNAELARLATLQASP